jgi:hypothetical protein
LRAETNALLAATSGISNSTEEDPKDDSGASCIRRDTVKRKERVYQIIS